MKNKNSIKTLMAACLLGFATAVLPVAKTYAKDSHFNMQTEFNVNSHQNMSGLEIKSNDSEEKLRIKHYNETESDDMTSFSVTLNKFSLWDYENSFTIFGNATNVNAGAGIESIHDIENMEYTVNAEYSDFNETEIIRLAGGWDYRFFPGLKVGTSIDTLSNKPEKKKYTYNLIRGLLSPNESNDFGVALRLGGSQVNANNFLGFWCNHGKKLGARTWFKVDQILKEEEQLNRYEFESIIAQNSTFTPESATWLVENKNGGEFDLNVLDNPESPYTYLADRTNVGVFGRFYVNYEDLKDSGNATVEAGYAYVTHSGITVFPSQENYKHIDSTIKVAPSVFRGHFFNNPEANSIDYNQTGAKLCIEATFPNQNCPSLNFSTELQAYKNSNEDKPQTNVNFRISALL
ncbi:MAG: hypothetical protein ACOYT4_03225 [Nanoarchaeota archaeon]